MRELDFPDEGEHCDPVPGRDPKMKLNNPRKGRMKCVSAIDKNQSSLSENPAASCFHSKSCKNTRIVFSPIDSAQLSSRSIRFGSNVSACHISNSFEAVAGV